MFKSCFDMLDKNNIKNINISYLNPVTTQNDFQKCSIQNIGTNYCNKKTYLSKPSINVIHEREYRDIQYSSCKTCHGSGFIENCLRSSDENINKNDLEKIKKSSPYKICISCHGTGKNDSETVFFYTCCQNKNRI